MLRTTIRFPISKSATLRFSSSSSSLLLSTTTATTPLLLNSTFSFSNNILLQQRHHHRKKNFSSSKNFQQQTQRDNQQQNASDERQMISIEKQLAQCSNEEFQHHVSGILKSNVSKAPSYLIRATLNDAEKRVSVLPSKTFRDVLLVASNRFESFTSSLNTSTTSQQQQQQQNLSQEFATKCVELFLQRTNTHSKDVAHSLLDSVVDAAYHMDSFEHLILLAEFGADKLIFTPEDYPTDVGLCRVLWRVICLGVQRVVSSKRQLQSEIYAVKKSNSNKENKSISEQIEKIQQEHKDRVKDADFCWKEAAEEVWRHMCRCNVQAKELHHNHRSIFNTLHRYVLYGASSSPSQQQQQSSSSNNFDGNPNNTNTTVPYSGSGIDFGEMHSFNFLYSQNLFVCSKSKSLQLYVSLIRTCKSGLWLEQAQFYFDEYQTQLFAKQQQTTTSLNISSSQNQNNTQNSSNSSNSFRASAKTEEILIFTLLSVFQTGKDYKRICQLGNALIDDVMINFNNEQQQETTNSNSTNSTDLNLNSSSSDLPDSVIDAISPSVLSTVAQAAGEVHDSLLVNKCLTLVLKKFARYYALDNNNASSNNNPNENISSDNSIISGINHKTAPSGFMLFQTLSAAAKSGSPEFPKLASTCFENGWLTPTPPTQQQQQGEQNTDASNSSSSFLTPFSFSVTTPNNTNANSNGTNNNNTNNNSTSMFTTTVSHDVHLHLLLQWALSCSQPHEVGNRLLSEIDEQIKALKRRANASASTTGSTNESINNEKVNNQISLLLTERCLNQAMQLLHRIEHPDLIRWYRLGRRLGYFRPQWLEMLVVWADRRRYSLQEDQRRYILDQFRNSGISEAGLRPMLSLLKFDHEEKPLQRFQRAHEIVSVEVAPTVLDPRVHFLRKGATKVTEPERIDPSPCVVGSRSRVPLTYQVAPPVLEKAFVGNINSNKKSSDSSTTTTKQKQEKSSTATTTSGNNNQKDALLLQWFLCSTLEGMQLHGNSFGIDREDSILSHQLALENAERHLLMKK